MSEKRKLEQNNVLHEKNKLTQARDRIAQSYLGLIGGAETQERDRRRIHWIASQVKLNDRVLDVGCSEGILAILLAREGIEVIGVDINAEALDYAHDLLEKELKMVRNRVTFHHGDLLNVELEESSFGTVILGEVLEHLLRPDLMLNKAISFLKPGGRLIVTTPFGYFPYPDHKQTFTLSELSQLLKPFVAPEYLAVVEGYIYFTGRKESVNQIDWSDFNESFLLKVSEQATIEQQKFLRGQIEQIKLRNNKIQQEYEQQKKELENAMDRAKKLREQMDILTKERDELVIKLESANNEVKKQIDLLHQKVMPLEQAATSIFEVQKDQVETIKYVTNLDEQLNVFQAEKDELLSKLEYANKVVEQFWNEHEEKKENTAQLKKQLNTIQEERDELKNKLKTAEKELDNHRQSQKEVEEKLSKLVKERDQLQALEDKNKKLHSLLNTQKESRNRAALNYYRIREQLEQLKKSITFQFGKAIVQAFSQPGRNTLALPIRLIRLVATGINKKLKRNYPVVLSVLFKLPNLKERVVSFTTNKPQYISQKEGKVLFSLPEGEPGYLASKENASFSIPPSENTFNLEPNMQYEISGMLDYDANSNVSLWLIEYDDEKRLNEHKATILNKSFKISFKTHQNHKKLVISIRLTGKGVIKDTISLWSIKQINEQKSNYNISEKAIKYQSKQPKTETYQRNRASLRVINWPVDLTPGKFRVMSIFDEFTRKCFQGYCTLIEPRPDNWEELLDIYKPHFAFIESAWRGNQGAWQYRVASYNNPPGHELNDLISRFKENGIQTVFWNKEDPVHFNKFIEAAKRCDIILTTAAEVVEKYRQHTSARVYTFPFAAEPSIHNPIGSSERLQRVCFAGSYYANRHVSRQKELTMLLETASKFDLDIFDRNYGTGSEDFMFPEQFQKFIRGRLPYEEMNRAYRRYRVFLNVNSVIDSPTMFSRRVYELLACGTPIISTPSRGIEETFGQDLVWVVKSHEEANEALEVLLNDDKEWRRRSLAGIREVMRYHTYRHRFNDLLDYLGLDKQYFNNSQQVLVIAEVWSINELECVLNSFKRQTISGKRLVVVARSSDIQKPTSDIEFIEELEKPIETIAEEAVSSNGATHIAYFSGKYLYGCYYLEDLVNATYYSGAELVGKDVKCGDRYAFTSELEENALLVDVNALNKNGFKLDVLFYNDKRSLSIDRGMRTFAPDGANFTRLDKNVNLNINTLDNFFDSVEV